MSIKFVTRQEGQKLQAEGKLAIDVSSYGTGGWNVLSPKYPHGNIPVPGQPEGTVSQTAEGIWQGLKDMPGTGIDLKMLETRKPYKRRGKPLGHLYEGRHLGVVEARKLIYIPTYKWVIENRPLAQAKFQELIELARTQDVYVYDFDSNDDVNVNRPYAHAALLRVMVMEAFFDELRTSDAQVVN